MEAAPARGNPGQGAAALDFLTAQRGILATRSGALLVTRNAGSGWTRVGRLAGVVSLRYGGGGELFAVVRRCVGARCTFVVTASTDGGRAWRARGTVARFPRNDEPRALSLVPTGPGRLVVGLPGRIEATDDGGRTWRELGRGCDEALPAALDFPDPRHGFLACGSQPATIDMVKTLYTTTDGGRTWRSRATTRYHDHQIAGTDIPMEGYLDGLRFRDARHGLLVAGRVGLYGTADGGRHWRVSLLTDDIDGVAALAWPTLDAIFVSTWHGDVGRSTDGGRTWQRIYPDPMRPPTGIVSFSSGSEAVGVGSESPLEAGVVRATVDGGRTWRIRGRIPGAEEPGSLARVSPTTLWASAFSRPADGDALFRSDDDGRTWRRVSGPKLKGDTAFQTSFYSARAGFVLGGEGTLWRTRDGRTWRTVRSGLSITGPRFVSPREGLALAAAGPSVMHTTDGGRMWRRLRIPAPVAPTAFATFGRRHWWVLGTRCPPPPALGRLTARGHECPGAIARTADAGRTWQIVRFDELPGTTALAFRSPHDGWVESGRVTRRTHDGGRTWEIVTPVG